jgi:hypothetical protein
MKGRVLGNKKGLLIWNSWTRVYCSCNEGRLFYLSIERVYCSTNKDRLFYLSRERVYYSKLFQCFRKCFFFLFLKYLRKKLIYIYIPLAKINDTSYLRNFFSVVSSIGSFLIPKDESSISWFIIKIWSLHYEPLRRKLNICFMHSYSSETEFLSFYDFSAI